MMMYVVPDTRPVIGEKRQDGSQSITLYGNNARKTYSSTPEKIDEYMSLRKGEEKKILKRSLISTTALTAIGAAIGFAFTKKPNFDQFDKTGALAIGGFSGFFTGMCSMIGIALKGQKNIEKSENKLFEDDHKS